jgi:hypothetical protein
LPDPVRRSVFVYCTIKKVFGMKPCSHPSNLTC